MRSIACIDSMPAADAAQSTDALTRLVTSCLIAPERALELPPGQWNVLLRALRRNALLASFAQRCPNSMLSRIPAKARSQMRYACIAAESARTAVRFEIDRMLRALRDYDGPLVLLKGAAYDVQALPPALGRVTGDVDVLVPRTRIDEVERRLTDAGWRLTHDNEYDQRYYREWTHEIPALLHSQRETPVDVHHSIAPLLGRSHPDVAALFAAAVTTPMPRLHVLGPVDMLLHATVHSFNDEVGHPLRDLYDLHLLLERFRSASRFWDELDERARLHGVERPLYYMLNSVSAAFGQPIPRAALVAAAASAPNPVVDRVMRNVLRARFSAGFVDSRALADRIAREMYYVRAHWLRMPPRLLVRHLSYKAVQRVRARFRRPDAAMHTEVA